jgi:prepilin-type N-terminal cleavage/methylation domain-containing protein
MMAGFSMADKSHKRGFTYIELVITLAIMAVLGLIAVPSITWQVQRQKERELRDALIQIRSAIDSYKHASDVGRIPKNADATGYPTRLQDLVNGVADQMSPDHRKLYFLRRLPPIPLPKTAMPTPPAPGACAAMPRRPRRRPLVMIYLTCIHSREKPGSMAFLTRTGNAMSKRTANRSSIRQARRSTRTQRGFSYVFVIFLLTMIAWFLMGSRALEINQLKREHERELLFVGRQFQTALASYAKSSDGSGPAAYPTSLNELLEDRRQFVLHRHLRKIFVDPMTRNKDWGLLMADGHIVGVYSRAQGVPLKQDDFDPDEVGFADAKHYSDWVFGWQVQTPPAPPAGS